MSKTLDPKIKRRWLRALRSGKFRQGTGKLQGRDLNRHTRYCCLGVLGNLYPSLKDSASNALLSGVACAAVGLSSDQQCRLSYKNDIDKWSFRKIADWIEENL